MMAPAEPSRRGRAAPSSSSNRSRLAAAIAALLIGLAPVLLVLTTWEVPYRPSNFRNIALPVLLAELLLPLLAVFAGCRPAECLLEKPRGVTIAIAALLCLSLANAALVSPKPGTAVLLTAINAVHGLAALSVNALVRERPSAAQGILRAMACGLVAYAIAVYALYATAPALPLETLYYSGAGVTNMRHLSFFGATGTMLALGLAFHASTRRLQVAWAACATICMAFVFWTGSRGAILALACTTTAAIILFPRTLETLKFWAMTAALAIPASLLSLIWIPDHPAYGLPRMIFSSSQWTGGTKAFTSDRSALWADAFRLFRERPFTGHGLGQFKTISPAAMDFYPQPHNFVLQFLFDWGALGALLGGFIILTVLRRACLAARRDVDTARIAVLGILVLLFYGLVDGTLFHIYPVFALTVLMAVTTGRNEEIRR